MRLPFDEFRLALSLRSALLLVLAGVAGAAVQAQSVPGSASATPDQPPTLHLYTDLMQVPTLVLSAQREPMKPVDPARFRISLDHGPAFKPTAVHREGEDPLSLAIVLDTSADPGGLVPNIEPALAALPAGTWSAADRVDVYVLDCALAHTGMQIDPSKSGLATAVHEGLTSWKARQGRILTKPCAQSTPLPEALNMVVGELAERQGRRVMVVMSQSKGDGGSTSWRMVTDHAHLGGVAIFGLTGPRPLGTEQTPGNLRPTAAAQQGLIFADNGDYGFPFACEFSGGVSLPSGTGKAALTHAFAQTLTMVRGRYILEFPRPANGTEGVHALEVTVTGSDAYVRPAGIVVPLRDQSQPGAPSNAPVQGGK